jgi:glycosyltransferase involved in cell wall biosynthesis
VTDAPEARLPAGSKRVLPTLDGIRILLVVPTFGPGGAQRQAFLLARYLAETERASVHLLNLGPAGALAAACDQYGIAHDQFELRHGYRDRVGQVWDALRFVALLRRRRIDVLLPYCMFQNIFCGMTWRLGGVKVCIWNQRDEGRSRLEPFVERVAVSQTRCFVSNSRHGASFLTGALRVPADRVHLVANGIELIEPHGRRAEWRRRIGAADNDFVACMAANLTRFKDHATLIGAWAIVVDRLRRSGRDAHLVLAGLKQERYEALCAQVQERGLERHVRFLGPVDDMPGLLEAVDLAVFSSCAEGVPNAVLEAMAARLCVVATDYPGIREAVGPEATERLARLRDPLDLAEKILVAAENDELRLLAGAQGRARVAAEFGVDVMGATMARLIRQELGRRRGSWRSSRYDAGAADIPASGYGRSGSSV